MKIKDRLPTHLQRQLMPSHMYKKVKARSGEINMPLRKKLHQLRGGIGHRRRSVVNRLFVDIEIG